MSRTDKIKQCSVAERLLTIENVCVSYDRPVLQNINASINSIEREGMPRGQIVCLLGPSGMGKTQLLRCIAGLQRPNSGSVRLNNSESEVMPGDVGFVAQHYPLFNHRTVLGNLLAASRKSGNDKKAREKSYAMLEEFHLADKALAYPQDLSASQRQCIAIAQQLLSSPHLLLMDEPFHGLDLLATDRVCETIARVSNLHKLNTMVVTHDIDSAISIADTLWILGREMDETGTPVPGASIREIYNLVEMGLAWEPQVHLKPDFFELSKHLKRQFSSL